MKIEAIVKYIVVSFLLFANLSCKENKDETLIAKVTDLTEEEEVISDIEYDGDGRIIRYGDTPIVYAYLGCNSDAGNLLLQSPG